MNIEVGAPPAPRAQARTHKLWGGRFGAGPTPEFDALNNSIGVDFRLWPYDVRLSKAWAVALWGANVLNLAQQYTDVTDWLPFFFAAEILVTLGLLAVFLWARLPTLGAATFAGCAVILAALLLARWTTQPYYAYLGGVAVMGLALVDRDARTVDANYFAGHAAVRDGTDEDFNAIERGGIEDLRDTPE